MSSSRRRRKRTKSHDCKQRRIGSLSQLAQTRAQLANHESVVSPGPAGRRIYSYPETSSISPPMAYPERLPTPNKRSMQSFSRTAPSSNRKRQRTRKRRAIDFCPFSALQGIQFLKSAFTVETVRSTCFQCSGCRKWALALNF